MDSVNDIYVKNVQKRSCYHNEISSLHVLHGTWNLEILKLIKVEFFQ